MKKGIKQVNLHVIIGIWLVKSNKIKVKCSTVKAHIRRLNKNEAKKKQVEEEEKK